MEVSGVENIGQCGRLSQLSWLLGALNIVYLLTYLLTYRNNIGFYVYIIFFSEHYEQVVDCCSV